MNNHDTSLVGGGLLERPRGPFWINGEEQNKLWRLLAGIHSTTPKLQIEHNGTGIAFHVFPDSPAKAFTGQIDPDDDTQIIIGKDRAVAGYNFEDTITIGLATLKKAVAETVVISETSDVYYDLTVGGVTITATLTATASIPAQVDERLYFRLGRAIWDGTAGNISQWAPSWAGGDIHIPARVD